MNNDPVRELVERALRRVRNIADEPGTSSPPDGTGAEEPKAD